MTPQDRTWWKATKGLNFYSFFARFVLFLFASAFNNFSLQSSDIPQVERDVYKKGNDETFAVCYSRDFLF